MEQQRDIKNKLVSDDRYRDKVETCSQVFGISVREAEDKIKAHPILLDYTRQNIEQSIKDLCKLFGFDKQTTINIFSRCPKLIGYTIKTIHERTSFIGKQLGMTAKGRAEIAKLVKAFPEIIMRSEDAIQQGIAFYARLFGDQSKATSNLRSNPRLLGLSEENINNRIKDYRQVLGMDTKEVSEMLSIYPMILTKTKDNVERHILYLQESLAIDKKQAISLIKKNPALINFSKENIFRKVASFKKIGYTTDDIVTNTRLFGTPNNTFTFRYMLSCVFAERKEFLRLAMQNEKKTYARGRHLKDNDKFSLLSCDEKMFQKRVGVASEDLIKQYPLNRESIKIVQVLYNQKGHQPPLQLSEEEIQAILATEVKPKLKNIATTSAIKLGKGATHGN